MALPPMQLHMILSSAEVPREAPSRMPPGYRLRPYRQGDEAGILEVLALAGFDGWDVPSINDYMRAPERTAGTHVVTFAGLIVAVTFASQETPVPRVGRLDFVAADPKHEGCGLGLAVSQAVVRYLLSQRYPCVVLSTDDWRLPAIKTYLKLGFRPKMIRHDMPDRWRKILEKLDWHCEPRWLAYPPPNA